MPPPSDITVDKLAEFRGHSQPIYSLSPSYRPGHLLSCGAEGIVAEWNTATAEGKALVQAQSPVYSMRLLPELKLLVIGLRSGELAFADLHTGAVKRRVQLHQGAIFDIAPFPDQNYLLASGEDGALSIWDLERLDHLHYQRISPKSIRTITFSPDGQSILTGGTDTHLRILDLGLNPLQSWPAHTSSIFRITWDPTGRKLYSTGRDAHIKSWKPAALQTPIREVPAHMYTVNDLVWHPDGTHLFSGSMDKTIKLWHADSLELLKVISFERHACHWNGVNRLLWHQDTLYSCSDDRRIMAWHISIPTP